MKTAISKKEKSEILASSFTGWLRAEVSGRTWSAKSCDQWSKTQAIRFEDGNPMECHTIVDSSGGWQNGDRAYGLSPSSYDDYYENTEFIEPIYVGTITQHKTDDSQQNYCNYKLHGATICESVALSMLSSVELYCALNNPTKHTITTALLSSPDYTARIIDAIGLDRIIAELGMNIISQHTDIVYSPIGWTQDPVILYVCETAAAPFGVLSVVDTTKRTPVFLLVPPTQTDSREALAWTFGLTVAECATMHLQS